MVNRTAIHYILVTLLEKGTSQNCKERKKDMYNVHTHTMKYIEKIEFNVKMRILKDLKQNKKKI